MLLFLSLLSLTVVVRSAQFVVDTGYAKYLGNHTSPHSVAYLGIPYAEPPVGDRRYRAPVALNTTRITAEANGHVVNATSYPDFCVQGANRFEPAGAGSEDCLKINIYAPTSGNNLPVLFYMHGGGYIFGNPATFPFDHWVEQSPNVVFVSVYYRLSSFGFLSHPAFKSGSYHHGLADLNVGYLDQLEALRWVRKHIRAFGGDPERVTINGQSAGGGSVILHLVDEKHRGEGLFSGAIAQSTFRQRMPGPDQMEALFDFFTEEVGCSIGSLAAKMACLRRADIWKLARAQDLAFLNRTDFPNPYSAFLPVVDGDIFTRTPTASLNAGNFVRVPMIVGATSNETYSNVTFTGEISVALRNLYPKLTPHDLAQFEEMYPAKDFESEAQQERVAIGDSRFICGQTIVGDAFSQRGLPTWAYRYNQPNPTFGDPAVEHAAENWMMFQGSNVGNNGTGTFTALNPTQSAFAEELIAYWISFVRARNPNTYKLERSPVWDGYETDLSLGKRRLRMVLQQIGNGNATRGDESKRELGSGSKMEEEPPKDVERCALVARMAKHEQN